MDPTTSRFYWRLCVIAALLCPAQTALAAIEHLVNPGIYTGTPSSTFNDPPLTFPIANLFDNINSTESVWAIQGYAGGNSQGRDEGWISVELNRAYQIMDLRFAARKPSGNTDGIDKAYIWVSTTPFGVNVTSNASTNAFLTTAMGMSPILSIGPFATAADIDYSLGAGGLPGRYLLARLVNTSDHNNDRNLGARTFLVGVVPEPGSITLAAAGLIALCSYGAWRRVRSTWRRRCFQ